MNTDFKIKNLERTLVIVKIFGKLFFFSIHTLLKSEIVYTGTERKTKPTSQF